VTTILKYVKPARAVNSIVCLVLCGTSDDPSLTGHQIYDSYWSVLKSQWYFSRHSIWQFWLCIIIEWILKFGNSVPQPKNWCYRY